MDLVSNKQISNNDVIEDGDLFDDDEDGNAGEVSKSIVLDYDIQES